MIIEADILIRSIFHSEPLRHRSDLHKTQSFIQMTGMNIIFYHSIELQDSKAMLFCLCKTICNQFFADMSAAATGIDSIACICNVPTAADIIGMQDIKPHDFSIVLCNAAICLDRKKISPCFIVQELFLRKSLTIFHHFIPDANHCGNILLLILSDFHSRSSNFRSDQAEYTTFACERKAMYFSFSKNKTPGLPPRVLFCILYNCGEEGENDLVSG